jgi:hypothetical protein
MSYLLAGSATRAAALRDRDRAAQTNRTDRTNRTDHDRRPEPSKLWTLIKALAYAGAFIDPSGVLAAQRFRDALEEERRDHR